MTMSQLQPICRQTVDVTVNNAENFIVQAFNTIKSKVVALAQTVFAYVQNTVWPFIQNAAAQTWTFLRTPAGFITMGGSLGLGLAYLASKVNEDEQPFLKGALHVAAVAAFVGTGIVVGLGVANGFTAQLI